MPPSTISRPNHRPRALGRQRPGVERVRLDHDEHGDAAQPVEVCESLRPSGVLTWRDRRGALERDVLPHRVPDRAVFLVGERDRAIEVRGLTSPRTAKCSRTATKRCGLSGARSATSSTSRPTSPGAPARGCARRRCPCTWRARRRAAPPATVPCGCRRPRQSRDPWRVATKARSPFQRSSRG